MRTRFGPKNNPKFDRTFKSEVERTVEDYKAADTQDDFVPVTLDELRASLNKLKTNSGPGRDGIFNVMLKHLSLNFQMHILRLFNLSLKKGVLPATWKEACITMIPKGQKPPSDPASYRPISPISCLSKVLERIVARRLSHFLESNNLLIKQQSGFRTGRKTSDNLIFLSQKIAEAFNRKKKVMSLFFDIEAAFDSVWHDALIVKLIQMKLPRYMINWVGSFLSDRSFVIKVGNTVSGSAIIVTGVPQGSALSPILFSVFINDVPVNSSENDSFSLLFAGDLNTFFIYKNANKQLQNKIDKYTQALEVWLCKWKLCMAPSKCQYTVFSKGNRANKVFGAKLFGEAIPYEANPISLGITFDPTLSFKEHISSIKNKCSSRLNIIKIFSHKSWSLTRETLVSIYRSLIGSVIDYAFFMNSQLSDILLKAVQVIQNNAMRVIFKQPFDATTNTLCTLSGLSRVEERMFDLNERFFESALAAPNELILDLAWGFKRSFSAREILDKTLLCDFKDLLETIV